MSIMLPGKFTMLKISPIIHSEAIYILNHAFCEQ